MDFKNIYEISNPQKQTKHGIEGNCLSACIATLFNIDINNVPNFANAEEKWVVELSSWLNKKYNKFAMPVKLNSPEEVFIFNGSMIIISINSDNPDVERHAVISVDNRIVFDPKTGIINDEKLVIDNMDPTYILIGDVISSC